MVGRNSKIYEVGKQISEVWEMLQEDRGLELAVTLRSKKGAFSKHLAILGEHWPEGTDVLVQDNNTCMKQVMC